SWIRTPTGRPSTSRSKRPSPSFRTSASRSALPNEGGSVSLFSIPPSQRANARPEGLRPVRARQLPYALGSDRPTASRIALRPELQKRNIGFVFQSYHLLDDLTVYENLEVPLSYRDVKRSERQAIVADVLDRFHIVGKKDLYPSQLSGGQQQLVAVARAVVAN